MLSSREADRAITPAHQSTGRFVASATDKGFPVSTVASFYPVSSQTLCWTDFDTLCQPHIEAVRAVLHGEKSRYKIVFDDITLVFHTGCLLTRVYCNSQPFSMPTFTLDSSNHPCLLLPPQPLAQTVFTEFLSLPKGFLIFYFSLLKTVFNSTPLKCKYSEKNPSFSLNKSEIDPTTKYSTIASHNIPTNLSSLLQSVNWSIQT